MRSKSLIDSNQNYEEILPDNYNLEAFKNLIKLRKEKGEQIDMNTINNLNR